MKQMVILLPNDPLRMKHWQTYETKSFEECLHCDKFQRSIVIAHERQSDISLVDVTNGE